MNTALMAAVLATVACGGTSRPDSTEPLETARNSQRHDIRHTGGGDMTKQAGSGEADEMAAMPPSIAKFHATLAPYWHAQPGPKRMADTCAAIPTFRADADAIAGAPPPDRADTAVWSKGGQQLAQAVTGLAETCKASDATGFETAFAQVHERFHGLMAAASGEHDHDEHGEHDRH